ncbi:MAG TPA: DUF4339 domain-containing protein [Candidatus Sulfotelmatobacter sp.]|nr:DUF4339 domain-containing protein [Candidatus Sulfotelmatobacter sp.]HWI58694.1 DUF4339 domain-containing protein [Bacillota bacterium]
MYRIIGADGKEYGPVSAEVMRQWLAEGRLNTQTRVLLEGTTEWKALGEFPELTGPGPQLGAPPAFSRLPLPSTSGVAEAEVNGPATGLIITAILGFVLQVISLIFSLVGTSLLGSRQMPNDAWVHMFSGTIGVASNLVGILVSGLILFGGIKMRKLESYGLAMTASIIAMIPCISPCCLVGLPIGIWAIVVLNKPEVKNAFH